MKKYIFLFPTLFFFSVVMGQNSWVQKLFYSPGWPYMHDDSLTGIKSLDIGPDGSIYVIANAGLSVYSELFKISQNGSNFQWIVQMGYHSGITGSFANTVHATADSGCIVSFNLWGESQCFHTDGEIQKYSSSGALEWTHGFAGNCTTFPYYDNEAYDVIENIAGNYYALVGDTLYEFDNAGNILRSDSSTSGRKIFELGNGNLIIQTFNNDVICKSFGGTVIWSIPSTALLSATPDYVFVGISSIKKIDGVTGSVYWTKSFGLSVSDLEPTADGGFIACSGYIPGNIYSNCSTCHGPGVIFKADSLGDTLWSRTYSLPYYGFGRVKQNSNGNYITGGAWRLVDTNGHHDFSSFITCLDSMGLGLLQTEEYIWPGNTNNNQLLGLSDDGLYTTLAFGNTGPARDSLSDPNPWCCRSDYAADWQDTSVTGANLKYADFNGDGIIDTNDVIKYTTLLYDPLTLPALRYSNPQNEVQSAATILISPDLDSIGPGDSLRFYVILGSQNQPVDTLCGVAFTGFFLSPNQENGFDTIINSDLGTVGVDNYVLSKSNFIGNVFQYFLSCRTDHQNIYNLNDTIGILGVILSSNIPQVDSIYFNMTSCKAIKCDGEIIPLNIVSRAAIIDPSFVSVHNIEKESVDIFPNPVSDILTVSENKLKGLQTEIDIYNSTGAKIKRVVSGEKNQHIIVSDWAEGIYFLSVWTGQSIIHRSVAIYHH